MPLDQQRSYGFGVAFSIALVVHIILLSWYHWFPDLSKHLNLEPETIHIKLGQKTSPIIAPQPTPPSPPIAKTEPAPQPVAPPPTPEVVAPVAPKKQEAIKPKKLPSTPKAETITVRSVEEIKTEVNALTTTSIVPQQKPAPDIPQSMVKKQPEPPQQAAEPVPATRGNELGNRSQANREIIRNYGETLSLWLAKHKLYPPEAQRAGMSGIATLYVQVERSGHIRYYEIEHPTGHPTLDDALHIMVERANPAPPIPPSYEGGSILGFHIEIVFRNDDLWYN